MLIIEDGSGKIDAESYIGVADANIYHALRGNTTWATLTEQEAEEALRRATDYMQQVYSGRWAGYKKTDTQSLVWPRSYVPNVDGYSSNYLDSSVIPPQVKNACAELAFRAARGELSPDLTQNVLREKIDVIEVEYDSNSTQYVRFRVVDNLLSAFMNGMSSGVFRRVVRT